jgi:hypothetical protein
MNNPKFYRWFKQKSQTRFRVEICTLYFTLFNFKTFKPFNLTDILIIRVRNDPQPLACSSIGDFNFVFDSVT